MNVNMQPNDDEFPPVAQDGAQNHGPELEAMPRVAGENHKPGIDEGPTTPIHLMSLEEFKRLVQVNSEEELAQHVKRFTKEQLDHCCVTDPTFALLFCKERLSFEQLEYCIRKDPLTALIYTTEVMTEKQIDICYRLRPDCALTSFQTYQFDAELLDFCIRKKPRAALRQAFSWDPNLRLTDDQFEFCFRKAPAEVLKHTASALKAAAHKMDEDLFAQCAMAEPATALQFGAGRMSGPLLQQCALAAPGMALLYAAKRLTAQLLKQCALAAPIVALRYSAGIMDTSLLKRCAQAKPWAAIRYATAHLSDDEILQYSAGRGSRIRRLLIIQPRHPLARRLIPLCDHLCDPVTAAAVVLAIASEI